MALPSRDRLGEYALKGAHLALRQAALAPEQVVARRLRSEAAGRAADGPKVVFVTPRDWAVHVQWEATMAQALRVRGARVSFVTCGGGLEICDRTTVWEAPPMPCGSCTRYVHGSLDAHGFPYVPMLDATTADDANWPELDELSVEDLPDVTADGLPLGEMASIPARWFLLSAQLRGDPLAAVTYRRFLRSARRIARSLDRTLDRERPDVVVLCNGLFLFEAIALELCRRKGIEVVTYERGMIRDTILMRAGALALFGDVAHVWTRERDVALTAAQDAELDEYFDDRRVGRRTIDTYWKGADFAARERGDGPGHLAVLFTNLTWDSAVIGRELAFPSLQAWLDVSIAWFAAHPEHQLVIRLHPAEEKLSGRATREPMGAYLAERHAELPANVSVIAASDPTSSYPLMEAADVGLVFSSTTGLEMAVGGTPVVVAATTHYRDKGFTVDVESPEAYTDALDRVMADPGAFVPDVDLARRYAHLFFFRNAIAFPEVEEHVAGLARIRTRHLDELAPGRSAALDRICGVILGDEAYREAM